MAIERQPNDPYSAATNDDRLRGRAESFDRELQADPELTEGPASGSRIAIFAIALVAILGVVFYGLNSTSTSPDATPTAQTAPVSPSGGTAQAPRAPAGQTTGSATRPADPSPPVNNALANGQNSAPAGAPSSN